MLSKNNFTEEHIRELQKTSRRDPVLLERAVYVFGLLEALTEVGLPFIFKGGSCLMLLFDHPMRLSTDIDIVVEPDTDIEEYIQKASVIFPFLSCSEQKRVGKNNIVKRHFKFVYNSPINEDTFYILLDILFEKNHYARIVEREIQNELLLTEGKNLIAKIPSPACLLGDKMTAFAPHTTGIPLGQDKEMEVMKQFYDVCSLINVLDDFADLQKTYHDVSLSEIAYRGIDITPEDCLMDSIRASVCIGSRGYTDEEEFPLFVRGARDLRTHIFSENFSPEIASYRAAKIAYLSACMLSGIPYEIIPDENILSYGQEKLFQPTLVPLKRVKKANPEAYAYAVKADRLLSEYLRK
ncbi:MAG: nucleotidyl transferase AbiEii/AbiGii toxin family protein [Anaerolineaceae bacterium]|nr:nucleotidyl transferase AbiEii/AbiGii toxin family protein [Anaerolineaceae bacterium]